MTGLSEMESNQIAERPVVAFVISLIAGIVVLSAGAMMAFAGSPYYWGYYGPMMGGYYGGMMGGYYGMMGGFGLAGAWFYVLTVIGVVAGIMILVGAIMVYNRPARGSSWGALILVSSIVSFLGMGGFFLGAVLGVVGGVLAMTFRLPQGNLARLQRP